MLIVVERVVIVIGEVPADEIVDEAVAVLIGPVLPARVGEQVARIDTAIAVEVAYGGRVGGVV
jgi:hypothetical protein